MKSAAPNSVGLGCKNWKNHLKIWTIGAFFFFEGSPPLKFHIAQAISIYLSTGLENTIVMASRTKRAPPRYEIIILQLVRQRYVNKKLLRSFKVLQSQSAVEIWSASGNAKFNIGSLIDGRINIWSVKLSRQLTSCCRFDLQDPCPVDFLASNALLMFLRKVFVDIPPRTCLHHLQTSSNLRVHARM